MIIDFICLNGVNILLSTVLFNIFYLDDKRVYLLLISDLLINGIPFVTIIIILIYYLNKNILLVLNNIFIIRYILLVLYYFIFNIILYSIFNYLCIYIISYLVNNLIYNLIIFYIGLKYLDSKYNLIGE